MLQDQVMQDASTFGVDGMRQQAEARNHNNMISLQALANDLESVAQNLDIL
jgi:hypothetical protein